MGRGEQSRSPGGAKPFRVVLVGAFRQILPEGEAGPGGSQGGFVDALSPSPYSLANARLQAVAEADGALRGVCEISRLELVDRLELEDEREEVALGAEAVASILALQPDLVAFSTYCWNIDAILGVTLELRRLRPRVTILLGGRGVEGDSEELLRRSTAVDALLLGEGERAFVEVLRRRGRGLSKIPGVLSRQEDQIISGPAPQCVSDLDELPSPYLEGLLEPPLHGAMLELSRGCLHGCGYCTWSADKRLRFFGARRIEDEVRWLRQRGHRHVTVCDAAINYDTGRLAELVGAIRRADPEGQIAFTYNVRHDALDDEQLSILAGLPTHMVLLGVESLFPEALAEVERAPVEVEPLRWRLRALAEATRPPVVSIVLGLPGDDEGYFLRTLDGLLEWALPGADGAPPTVGAVLVSLLQVYRGSALWRRRDELGLVFQDRGIPYLLESPSWPPEALARAKASLIARMAAHPDLLKAAEAIVLVDSRGGVDPWLSRRRVTAALGWPLGEERRGWTLLAAGLQRDTARAFSLRFRWRAGGQLRLALLRRRDGGSRGPGETRLYRLEVRPVPGAEAPLDHAQGLRDLVLEALLLGEERLARAAAGQPGRYRRGSPGGSSTP